MEQISDSVETYLFPREKLKIKTEEFADKETTAIYRAMNSIS